MFSRLTQGLPNTKTPPPFVILVQTILKIYSFQAAGKNKIVAKDALLPDIYSSIKQFFA